MVLEENLLFYDEEDADMFIEFLLGKNCRVQKMTEGSIYEETLMKGRIGDLITIVKTVLKDAKPGPFQNPPGSESPGPEFDDPSGPADSETWRFLHAKMLDNMESIRDRIREMTAQLNPGDILVSADELKQMKQRVLDCFENDPEVDKVELLIHEILLQDCLQIMEENGMAETGTEGMVLLKKTGADDLIIERRAWDPDEVDPDILKSHNISLDHHIDFGTTIRVLISPRIHFNCEQKEIVSVLDDLEVDDDRVEVLVRNMYRKSFVIDAVLDKIETAGRISLTDLIREMKSVPSTIAQEDCQLFLDSSEEFITCLVNDLRKAGVIEGNDRKIRAVR
jgi:hypothetical protein